MTDERLDDLEALAANATPGPWYALPASMRKWVMASYIGDDTWRSNHENDAAFVAAARDAVPELVAEVRRLRGVVRAASEFYEWHMKATPSDVLDELVDRRSDLQRQLHNALQGMKT